MNLNDYFDPVSLEKPSFTALPHDLTFSRRLTIHTPDQQVSNPESFDIAIIGVPEEKNAVLKGVAQAPDTVREQLYQLCSVNRKTRIADLGNLKITNNINDTYYGLRDIIRDLEEKSVIPVIIGGSHDLTFAVDLAFNSSPGYYHMLTIDNRVDMGFRDKGVTSRNFVENIIHRKDPKLFNYTNIGHQVYYTPSKITDHLEKKGYDSIRVGTVRNNLPEIEPVIRDATVVSIDMCSVRQADAPGVSLPSPNGFFGHEICQLARYAGSATHLKAFGIFEICPANDPSMNTSQLAAQMIWYFIEGYSIRIKEDPQAGGSRKFIVHLNSISQDISFYKSLKTERWWIEMPFLNPLTAKNYLVPCSVSDYQMACNNEIPDRWWKAFHRLS